MHIEHRCFLGQSFRPSPAVKSSKGQIAVITPWNTHLDEANRIIEGFENNYRPLVLDIDSTQPFQKKQSLSSTENNIRTALIQLNEQVFNQYNEENLSVGFEVCILIRTETETIIAQVGNPQAYLSRKEWPLQPISPSLNLSHSYSKPHQPLPPLPQDLLGLFPDVSLSIQSFKTQPQDQVILISRNIIPTSFLENSTRSIESLSSTLAQDSEEEPFWLGVVQL